MVIPVFIFGVDIKSEVLSCFPKLDHFDYIQSFDSSVLSITIPNWTCNDIDYSIFDFLRFTRVKFIKIGNNSFCSVRTFRIDGLNRLKTLEIGINSFTQQKTCNFKKEVVFDESKSFHILNCESLGLIQIGYCSFSDYGGEVELKNLPNLSSIDIGNESLLLRKYFQDAFNNLNRYKRSVKFGIFNFCSSPLVIKSINKILNKYHLDLPNLQSIKIKNCTFKYSHIFCIKNLDSLRKLEIGNYCFLKVVKFEINGLNSLEQVIIGKNSFTLTDSSEYERDSEKALKNARNEYRSFHIVNCKSLVSIEIGTFSFFDYAGQFELRNLPKLDSFSCKSDDSLSYNFYYSSFVIRGII